MSKYSGKSDLYDLLNMHYKVIGDDKSVDLVKLSRWEIDAGGITVTGKEYRDLLPYFGNVAASSSHQHGEDEHHVVHLQPIPYFAERARNRAEVAMALWTKGLRTRKNADALVDYVAKNLAVDPETPFWKEVFWRLRMSDGGNVNFSPYMLLNADHPIDIHYAEWRVEMLLNNFTEHEIHGYLDADS